MNRTLPTSGRHLLDGGLRVLAAEALFPVTALITAVYLTRRLGPEGYGLLTLAVSLVCVVQWLISDFFASATVHQISRAEDWVPVGRAVLRAHFFVALVGGVVLALCAGWVAGALGQAELAPYLRLLAIDLPLYGLVLPHRFVLTGLGRYRGQAVAMACRWVARLVLIVLFVELGWSVRGALVGLISATVVELVVVRFYVRLPVRGRSGFRIKDMAPTIVPLFVFSVLMRVFGFSDIVLLKVLGGTIGQVGVYAAGANLAVPIGLVAGVVAPVLLSGLSGSVAGGDVGSAQGIARQALRIALLLLPFIGLVCGAASGLVSLFFGRAFVDAGPVFVVLAVAGGFRVLLEIAGVILIAAQKASWCVVVGAVVLGVALLGHVVLIPRLGGVGAAVSMFLAMGCGAVVAMAAAYRVWGVALPGLSLLRCGVLGAVGYALPGLLPVGGAWVVVQLVIFAVLMLIALVVCGELSREERVFVRSVVSYTGGGEGRGKG